MIYQSELPPLKFDCKRQRVKYCPCGHNNKDGKFVPFKGYDNKGYCHSCGQTFLPEIEKDEYKPAYVHGVHTVNTVNASFIDRKIFEKSLTGYEGNIFVQYLKALFGEETTKKIIDTYYIGTSKHWTGSTIFWQIDISGKIRAGKVMLYGEDGHRSKNPDRITWAHSVLNLPHYELKQCFFGEHLMKDNHKPMAIVESEKTACIASAYLPQFLWLACGQLQGLSIEKCQVLKGKTVTLFPDLNGFEKWTTKAKEIQAQMPDTHFIFYDYLQKNVLDADKLQGYDLADYLIRYNQKEFVVPKPDRWAMFNRLLNKAFTITKQLQAGTISGAMWQFETEGILLQANEAGISDVEFYNTQNFWN
jgi:hypothetical protein